MASLEMTPGGNFHVVFWFQGQRYKRALKTKDEAEASRRRTRLEDTILLVQSGRLKVPLDADVPTFLLSDGKLKQISGCEGAASNEQSLSLQTAFAQFFASIPEGNLEENTLYSMHQHEKHLLRLLGAEFVLSTLNRDQLQAYVAARSKEKTHLGTTVSATTINKELGTLRSLWRWAEGAKIVSGVFPRAGLRLPKGDELPPFQTWDEIERQIKHGGLDDAEASALWDALYLRRSEIDELLEHVREHAAYPFLYPMIVMAAHTGARRSELMRSQCVDFDLERGIVTIREKKRVRGRNSTRRVPMSKALRAALTEWFETDHPGSPHAFCHVKRVARSGSRSQRGTPLTSDQAHDHFKRTLKGSRWERIKGWHCLRHSFISNLASEGIDQRLIDEFVGHTTEEMRRRYRHLFPDVKQAAIDAVFG